MTSLKKSLFTGVLLGMLGLTSCTKSFLESDLEKSKERDETAITNYAQEKNLTNLKTTADGIHYQITETNPGGEEIGVGKLIRANLKLSLLNGTVAGLLTDTTEGGALQMIFYSGAAIEGLMDAFTLLKEGEKGTFLIPSSLAFGGNAQTNIPAWSPIRIDLEVLGYLSETEQIDEYIAKKKLQNVQVTASGLRYVLISAPTTGDSLINGNTVTAAYNGMFLNDQSFDKGDISVLLGANRVVPGFEEGIKKTRVGEKALLIMPSSLAYGANGAGSILPYTPLAFEIEVKSKK